MTRYERRRSSDSFDSRDWVDPAAYEEQLSWSDESGEDDDQNDHLSRNRMALAEERECIENRTNYGHSDEGVQISSRESQRFQDGESRMNQAPDFSWRIHRYLDSILIPGSPAFANPFDPDTRLASDANTPASPRSTRVEPASSSNNSSNTSSGRSSMTTSMQLQAPPATTENLLVGIGQHSDPAFQATPAANANYGWTPLFLGHTLMLPLGSIMEDSGYLTGNPH